VRLRKLAIAAIAAAMLGGVAAPAFAHHAINAQFDVTKLVAKEGVLTKLDNVNPHAYWHFDIKDADGRIEEWNIESVAPNALRAAGISMKNDIRIGQDYKFQIAPSRNGSNTGLLLVLEVNGKTIRLVAE
jgi:hypothetical protein